MAYPVVLGFPDRKIHDERARVIGEDGELVATLSPASRRYRFDAEDADGKPLCSGRMRAMMGWEVVDPSGAPLVSMGPGFFGRYRLRLRDGMLTLVLRGRAYKGDLRVMSGDDFVINSLPSHGAWTFGDTDWIIRSDGSLTLVEMISVVELHRLEMRRRRKPSVRQRRRRPQRGLEPAP